MFFWRCVSERNVLLRVLSNSAQIFHVNADDVEAVCRVFKMVDISLYHACLPLETCMLHAVHAHAAGFASFLQATDWRQEFKCDVVIDLIGYRRFGHNEIDEPTFTQPLMYQVVNKHPSVLKVYTQSLEAEGVLTKEEIDAVVSGVTSEIEASWENKVPNQTRSLSTCTQQCFRHPYIWGSLDASHV